MGPMKRRNREPSTEIVPHRPHAERGGASLAAAWAVVGVIVGSGLTMAAGVVRPVVVAPSTHPTAVAQQQYVPDAPLTGEPASPLTFDWAELEADPLPPASLAPTPAGPRVRPAAFRPSPLPRLGGGDESFFPETPPLRIEGLPDIGASAQPIVPDVDEPVKDARREAARKQVDQLRSERDQLLVKWRPKSRKVRQAEEQIRQAEQRLEEAESEGTAVVRVYPPEAAQESRSK